MKVYMKNIYQQQTVRDLPLFQILKLRFYAFVKYPKDERPIVRFVI